MAKQTIDIGSAPNDGTGDTGEGDAGEGDGTGEGDGGALPEPDIDIPLLEDVPAPGPVPPGKKPGAFGWEGFGRSLIEDEQRNSPWIYKDRR